MSKITRENILDSIDFGYQGVGEGTPIWTDLDLKNAMIAAYNRALEDAVKIANTRQTREMILKQIEGLKVG